LDLDVLLAGAQVGGDLLVQQTGRDPRENLLLPRREAVIPEPR